MKDEYRLLRRRNLRPNRKTLELERWYRNRLKQVAEIIEVVAADTWRVDAPQESADQLEARLREYSASLNQWATIIAREFLGRAASNDWAVWRGMSELLGNAQRREIERIEQGEEFELMLELERELITSLPIEAAEKAQTMARQGMYESKRFEDIYQDILRLGDITESRAILIARTETSRARTEFTKLRAEKINSPGFIWRTVGDGTVRPTHKVLNGKFFPWNQPPLCDYRGNGEPVFALPGCVWNCRCIAIPLIPKSKYEYENDYG